VEIEQLEQKFAALGLNSAKLEFYNTPGFLKEERRNPELLWDYEEFVLKRRYSPEYEARARHTIPKIVDYLFNQLVRDGRLGACLDACLSACKMLERYGFWNIIQTGSFTAVLPDAPTRKIRYWPEFTPQGGKAKIGHAWLIAPPFKIVELTVTRQEQNEDLRSILPPYVIATDVGPVEGVSFEDMVDVDLKAQWMRQRLPIPSIHELMVHNKPVARHLTRFRPFSVTCGTATLKYFPVRPTLPEETFEDQKAHCWSGRQTSEMFRDLVTAIGSPEEIGFVPQN